MNPVSILSQCSIICLTSAAVVLSSSVEAQYIYGVAGSRTPTPRSATGLPIFELPRAMTTTGVDDVIEWASDKKIDPKHHEKEVRDKAQAKRESQRREAEKREAEKKEKEKRDTEKREAEKREAVQQRQELSEVKKKDAAEVPGNKKEAVKPDNADDELRLKEPLIRDRVTDVWDRDLPTERPMQDGIERQLMEMRAHRERLIREHGQDHPSVRTLSEAIEQIRNHRGSRQEHPQNSVHEMGPNNIGPRDMGPHNMRPHSSGPQDQPIDSVGELKRTIDSIDRIVERLGQQRQAMKNEQRDRRDDDDDDDDSNREQLEDIIQLQLELRQRIKNFQVEMLRLELERAEMEAELFEESLDAMHKVKVLELLHR